jgi:hypothetical protein
MPTRALILIPLLFLACGREPAGPAPRFSVGFENAPLNPGRSLVVRTQTGVYWTSVLPAEDLVIRHFDAEHADFCGGSAPATVVQEQWMPTLGLVYLAWFRDQPVYVYRNSEVPPQDVTPQFCEDLETKWIYRGVHSYRHHDQDYEMSVPGADEIRTDFIGTLYDPAGHRYGYREFHMFVQHPDAVGGPSDHPEYLDFYRLVIR